MKESVSNIIFESDITTQVKDELLLNSSISVDIETSGLDWKEDNIGTVQVFTESNRGFIIQVSNKIPVNLNEIFQTKKVKKIFHHAMFDLRFMINQWDIDFQNVACTKVASKILFDIEEHSLKNLLSTHLDIEIKKDKSTSNWLKRNLDSDQIRYAIEDVKYLKPLLEKLKSIAINRKRNDLIEDCFKFLPLNAWLQVNNFDDVYEY